MKNRELFNQKWQIPYRKKLRNHSTYTEVLFWNRIKNRQVGGLKFRRQHGIGKYIVDFYCPEIKLAIELDGLIHNTEERIIRDMKRDDFIQSQGVSIIRIPNSRAIYKFEDYAIKILEHADEFRLNSEPPNKEPI